MKKIKIIVAGNKEILNCCIEELASCPEVEIPVIYTSKVNESSLHSFLQTKALNIPVKICDIKKDLPFLKSIRPTFLFSFQYNYRINREIIDLLDGQCFNLHFSLLPRYGGCYPIFWAIKNGETTTGVTLHFMTDRFDDGDIVAQKVTTIEENETSENLYLKQTQNAFYLFKETLPQILQGRLNRTKQDKSQFLYYDKKSVDWEKDCFVDWSKDALTIHNHIRAFTFPQFQLPKTFLNSIEVTISDSKVKEFPTPIAGGGVNT